MAGIGWADTGGKGRTASPHQAVAARRIILAALFFGRAAIAQEAQPQVDNQAASTNNGRWATLEAPYVGAFGWPQAAGTQPRFGVASEYSYVASGDISYRGLKGSSDAHAITPSASGDIPINEKWFIPVGMRSENLFLGTVAGAPIPDRINTFGLDTGAGYHINSQWTVAATIGPVLYRFDDIGGDEIGIHGAIRATYIMNPKWTFIMGLGFEPDSEVPVLPAAGLRWRINTNLTLNLMFPKPALIYRVLPRLSVYVGGGGEFAVFRTESDFGNQIGLPQFNSALGTYRDFHVGAGAEYRLPLGASVTVEAGYSVGRQINYKDIDQTISFDPAPYVQAGLRWRF